MPSRPRPGGETGRTTPPWSGPARVEEAAGRAGNTKQCPPSHPRDLQAQTSSDVAPSEEQGGNGAERSWSRVPKVTALCGRTGKLCRVGARVPLSVVSRDGPNVGSSGLFGSNTHDVPSLRQVFRT